MKKKQTAKKTSAAKKRADLRSTLAARVDAGETGSEPAKRSIERQRSAKPKAPTAVGGGKSVGIFFQPLDLETLRKLRRRALVDSDLETNQSQLLRAGLLALDELPSAQVADLLKRVQALDGRKRSQ